MERCERHGVETRVTCSNCGTPICPRCMIDTAVGIKCPDCAAPPRSVSRALRRSLGRAWAAAVGSGLLTGVVFSFIRFPLFRSFITGLVVSEAVLRAGRRQTGGPFLAAGLVGALVGELTWATMLGFPAAALGIGLLFSLGVAYFRLR